ncbi:SOS-response transcriptional repressor LexA [Azospirillum agricola]|uniref:LexA family protein n=1 Tax=Azospirillum agricola TaxID=1720247 RepID=UPI001AE14EBC|nr:hypothetical protein [Azospirillum agricola]MBP2229367.1 SOS-response transcriptional repressor LexA [Azospirillum agricola]
MAQAWTGPIPLTRCQLEALQVLHELVDVQGLQPTYLEIGCELELVGKSGVSRVLRSLEEKGWIELAVRPPRIRLLLPPPMLPDVGLEFVGRFDDGALQAAYQASLTEGA